MILELRVRTLRRSTRAVQPTAKTVSACHRTKFPGIPARIGFACTYITCVGSQGDSRCTAKDKQCQQSKQWKHDGWALHCTNSVETKQNGIGFVSLCRTPVSATRRGVDSAQLAQPSRWKHAFVPFCGTRSQQTILRCSLSPDFCVGTDQRNTTSDNA